MKVDLYYARDPTKEPKFPYFSTLTVMMRTSNRKRVNK